MDTDAKRTLAMLFFVGIIGGAIAFGVGLTLRSGQSDEPVYASANAVSDIVSVATPVAQEATDQLSKISAIADQSGDLTGSFIRKVEPAVVVVTCTPLHARWYSQGSGISYRSANGTNYILTNFHVFKSAYSGRAAPFCLAFFPQPPNYDRLYAVNELILDQWRDDPRTHEDSARFRLGRPLPNTIPLSTIPAINDAFPAVDLNDLVCSAATIAVGEKITVFGYPSSGNLLGISETVVPGTISGELPGPIYKTTAPIDHGNSGGVAILDKKGCLLGIPTLGKSGLTGGTGYIQSFILAGQ